MSGKRYTEEFKIEAIKPVSGYSVANAATHFDITTQSLCLSKKVWP